MTNVCDHPYPLTAQKGLVMGNRWRIQKWTRTRGTGIWTFPWLLLLLLLLSCVSGLQAVNIREVKMCLIEGGILTLTCPYNIRKYAPHPKAWQRVRSQGPPETLVRIETRDPSTPNQVQVGRYLLEDLPTEAVVKVTMTGLQRQDEGLYQCVVDLSPSEPFILHDRIRLTPCDVPSATVASKNPIQTLSGTVILLSTTTETLPISTPRPTTVTQFSSVSSSGANLTNVEDVTRVSMLSIVIPVVCGILSKSLVFTVLLVVTQRSAAR